MLDGGAQRLAQLPLGHIDHRPEQGICEAPGAVWEPYGAVSGTPPRFMMKSCGWPVAALRRRRPDGHRSTGLTLYTR
jgi:hypothetical protein